MPQSPSKFPNGAIGFSRNTGIIAKAIRLASWLRFHNAKVNHAFYVSPEGKVWQAEPKGVTDYRTLDEVAPGGHLYFKPLPEGVNRERVEAFLAQETGSHYDFLAILSCALDIITPSWFPAFRRPGSWECAALIGEALRAGGWIKKIPDIYTVYPEELDNLLE